LDRLGPMEATEGPSALEVATAENSALKDGVDAYPAPKGVAEGDSARVGSASHCPAPEGTAGDYPAHDGTELVSAGLLQTASGGDLTPGHQLISHDLGVPSFFSNLQVL
jgi:hypothetical protein